MTEFGTEPLRAIERPYVERVRFSWERKLETALAHVRDPGKGRDEDPWPSPVRLTESSAPRVYRVALEVAETLGATGRFVLFQTRALDHVNARAFRNEDPFVVGLIGPAISSRSTVSTGGADARAARRESVSNNVRSGMCMHCPERPQWLAFDAGGNEGHAARQALQGGVRKSAQRGRGDSLRGASCPGRADGFRIPHACAGEASAMLCWRILRATSCSRCVSLGGTRSSTCCSSTKAARIAG
jgi:hypothetical protein